MGNIVKLFCWLIVYKFLVEEVLIKLFDIELNVGRIGVIIFIVVLELVWVVGIIVSCVLFYNEDLIIEKDICIGDIVLIKKVGDIILEVIKSIIEKCSGSEEFFYMLKNCLVCDSELVWLEEEVVLRCINFKCLV